MCVCICIYISELTFCMKEYVPQHYTGTTDKITFVKSFLKGSGLKNKFNFTTEKFSNSLIAKLTYFNLILLFPDN